MLSLVISAIAVILSIFSYLRDRPVPIVLNINMSEVPDHGLFSYRPSRRSKGEAFFFFNAGVLVDLKLTNPSSKSITLYSLSVNQKDSPVNFYPLCKSNAGNASGDKLYCGLSKNDFKDYHLMPIPLYESLDFVVPAYGVIDVQVFFKVTDWKKLNNISDLLLQWKYAKRKLLWPLLKLFKKDYMCGKKFNFEINQHFIEKPELLHPEKLLPQSMLRILSSD